VVQPGEVFHQAQPSILRDLLGVALGQLELAGHGPDRRGVMLNQAVPRLMLPLRRALHHERGIESVCHSPEATTGLQRGQGDGRKLSRVGGQGIITA
jgi:hypothetical protein